MRKAHISLLEATVSELVLKVATYVDPFYDSGESKSKRREKKDSESSSVKKMKSTMLQINELTWPELAPRFILVILLLEGSLDSAEINSSLKSNFFHCLQGDGGILCGSLTGVTGMEADASRLKQVFSLPKNNKLFSVDQPKPNGTGTPSLLQLIDVEVSEWAQALESVRKLRTNVEPE